MKRKNLQFESGFRVVLGNAASQGSGDGVIPWGGGRRSGKTGIAARTSGYT